MASKLSLLLCGLLLGVSIGCQTVVHPDGLQVRQPDYAVIEFGSTAIFTVIINETEVSDEVVLRAHDSLAALRNRLQCVDPVCESMDLSMLETEFMQALPIEYQALGVSGMRLMRSKLEEYMNYNGVPYVPTEVQKKVFMSVLDGAIMAFLPHIQPVKKTMA